MIELLLILVDDGKKKKFHVVNKLILESYFIAFFLITNASFIPFVSFLMWLP